MLARHIDAKIIKSLEFFPNYGIPRKSNFRDDSGLCCLLLSYPELGYLMSAEAIRLCGYCL